VTGGSLVDQLAGVEEVTIVTRASPDGPEHRTIIWVVAVDGRLLARTYRGPLSRWYREALAHPDCALDADGRSHPVTVSPVVDRELWTRGSEAYRVKYAGDPSTPAMVRSEVLPTTIEFHPR
jgi:hypothetical protein